MFFYTNVYNRGNVVDVRGIKDGKKFTKRVDFQPTLFARSSRETGYKSLHGHNLSMIEFNSINDAKDYIRRYEDVENHPIYGQTNFGYQYITDQFPDQIEWDISQIKIVTIDIETSTEYGFPDAYTANESVLLISIQDFNTKQITTFGCNHFLNKQDNVNYVKCDSETDLLAKFINFIRSDFPDVITGWNVNLFDMSYLSARITKILGETSLNDLSPFGRSFSRETSINNRNYLIYEWAGIAVLDYLDLYRKFSYKTQESYRLDHIAQEELGKAKIKSPYATFKEFYTNDWQLFVEYNIVDVELVDQLEDKMKLIELIMTMAYDAKCNYADIFSPVRTWDCILYNALWKRNTVIQMVKPPEFDRPIIGAFVKDPVPGSYDWVVSFDATSLYPSIIMSLNMSPECLINGMKYLEDDEKSIQMLLNRDVKLSQLKDDQVSMSANGQCFSKEKKGIFPELIEYYFAERQKAKKQMLADQTLYEQTKDKKYLKNVSSLNSKQMAAKILMNSLYGAMGNKFFRYYDNRIAEGITMTGQLVIRSVAKKLNTYLNKICNTKDVEYAFYCDTDSAYITLGNLVNSYYKDKTKEEIVGILDKICGDKIEGIINSAIDDLGDYINVYQNKLRFKREVIADRGVWIAKKRYALNVYNSEGIQYAEPKLKVMGLEIVRSSTPAPVRKALKDTVGIVLKGDEPTLRQYVQDLEKRWHDMAPDEIAFPRSVNGMGKYSDSATIYKKGTPIHVAGALLYNYLLDQKKLTNKYQKIQEGDKIKFLYLKEPNIVGSHVITFQGEIPPEFNLAEYIDYDKMLDKSFLEPLNTLVSCVGWKVKQEATLEGLFE